METNVSTNGVVTQTNVINHVISGGWFREVFTTTLLQQLVLAAVVVIAAFVLTALFNRLFRLIAEQIQLPRLALTPVRILARVLIFFLAGIIIFNVFGYQADAIFTVLATILGLVAIGFVAVWSILSNFLCTFVLILFKPFSVGDDLEFPTDNVSGTVVDLTLLFTTLRGAGGELYQIPNNMFFQKMFKRRVGAAVIGLDQQLKENKPADQVG